MNCHDIARILDERDVDGLLSREQSDVRAHLVTCRDCARDWQIHAQLADARIPAVPTELRALYSPQVGGVANLAARQRSRFVVLGTVVAVAAAAAMLALQMNTLPAPVAATVDPVRVDPVQVELSAMQGIGKVLPSPTEPVLEDWDKVAGDWQKAVGEWTPRVVEWLVTRDDPDALFAAAILLREESGPVDDRRFQSLLQRASALAPASARIQAMTMFLCRAEKPCDATPYEQALRRLAPDNALGWVDEVYRASQVDDQEALRNALTAMSRAKTFDQYSNANTLSIVSQISGALVAPPEFGGHNPFPSISKDRLALFAIEEGIPGAYLLPITKFCESTLDERALLECRRIGAAMRVGDTLNTNLAGVEISSHGLPADSAEAHSLQQERNLIEWIARKSHEVFSGEDDGRSEAEIDDFLRRLPVHPREIDLYRAVLEEHGIPREPPADWKP
jgi:hypothetical protein